MGVDEDREIVGPVAEEGEPLGVPHDDVEFVAVHDEKPLAVRRRVFGVADDLDAAERQADELPREFVVIARHEHHARAAPDLAQKLLDDVVMRLRPVEARAHAPAVEDVADEIDRVGVVVARKSRISSAWQPRVPRCMSETNSGAVAMDGRVAGVDFARAGHDELPWSIGVLNCFAQILMSAP